MVGTIQQPYQAQAWYDPYFPQIDTGGIQAESPQAPENKTLDTVELTLKSIYTGRVASASAMGQLENRISLRLNHLSNAGLMATAAATAAKNGALFAGGVSLVRNVVSMASGDINMARASGNITADIAGGALGGIVAGAGAGITVAGLSNASNFLAGTMGSLVGAIGFAVADAAYNATGLRGLISEKVTSVLEDWQQSTIPDFNDQVGVQPGYVPYSPN